MKDKPDAHGFCLTFLYLRLFRYSNNKITYILAVKTKMQLNGLTLLLMKFRYNEGHERNK